MCCLFHPRDTLGLPQKARVMGDTLERRLRKTENLDSESNSVLTHLHSVYHGNSLQFSDP